MRRFLGLNKKVNEAKKLAAQQAAEQQAAEQFTTAVAAIVENYKRDDFDANKQEIQQEIQTTLRNLSTTYSDEIVKLEYMSQLMRKIQDLDYDFGATSSPDQAKEKLVVMRYVDAILEVYQKMEPQKIYPDADSFYMRDPVMHELHKKLFIEATLVKYKLLVTETTTAETAAAGQKTFFYNPADKLDDLEKYLFYAVSYADGDEQVKKVWRNIRALTYDADQKKLAKFCADGEVDAMLQHYTYMVFKWGNHTEDNIKQIDSIVMQAVIEKLGTLGVTIGNELVPTNAELYPNILAACATLFSIRTIRGIIPNNTYLDLAQKVIALLQQPGVRETMQQHQWWLPFLCNIERKLGETQASDSSHILEQHNLTAENTATEIANAQRVIYSRMIHEYFASPDNKLDSYNECKSLVEKLYSVHNEHYSVNNNEKYMALLNSMLNAVESNRDDIKYYNLLFVFLELNKNQDCYYKKLDENVIQIYVNLSAYIDFEQMSDTNKNLHARLMSYLIKKCQNTQIKNGLQDNFDSIYQLRLNEPAVEEKINLYLSGALTLPQLQKDTLGNKGKVRTIISKRIEAADPDNLSLSELNKLNVMLGMVAESSFAGKRRIVEEKIAGFIEFVEDEESLKSLSEILKDVISQDVIVDPFIVSPAGHTYSRAAIEEWMKGKGQAPDPTTRAPIQSIEPNQAIANLLDEVYRQHQAGAAIDLQKILDVAKAGVRSTEPTDFMLQNCIEVLDEMITANNTHKNDGP